MLPKQEPAATTGGRSAQPRRVAAQQRNYYSYLLRIWCDEARQLWRAELHSASSEQILNFSSCQDLFDFLNGHGAADADQPFADASGNSGNS